MSKAPNPKRVAAAKATAARLKAQDPEAYRAQRTTAGKASKGGPFSINPAKARSAALTLHEAKRIDTKLTVIASKAAQAASHVIHVHAIDWTDHSISVLEDHINAGHNRIEILVVDKQGNRMYPQSYYMSGDDIRSYPSYYVGDTNYGVVLYKIPVKELQVLRDA